MRAIALALLLAAPLLAQDDQARRIEALIRLLGGDDPARSEAASRELLDIGRPALKPLRAAAKAGDARLAKRVNDIYPYVRWGVRDTCPQEVLALLAQIEVADAQGKGDLLRQLAKLPAPAAEEALYTAWWDVDDPALLAELAATERVGPQTSSKSGLDPDAVERRLCALKPDDDPRILRARAEAKRRAGDDAGACDLFGRIPQGDRDEGLLAEWGESLAKAGRHSEAADVLGHAGLASLPLRVRCLYRSGKREDAEAALAAVPGDSSDLAALLELALSNGSALFVAERATDPSTPTHLAAEAWIHLGKLDRAEEAWRRIEDRTQRRRILDLLLDARGESSLLTPAFISETLSPQPEDAQRHARLAAVLEKTDAASSLREWRKARLLDPSRDECAKAIERLAAHATDAPGCSTVEVPSPPAHLLFATSPVRLGDFYYYRNEEGDILKVKDPLRPNPAWAYAPPRTRETRHRGISVGGSLPAPVFARRGADLLVLFQRSCWYQDPAGGGSGFYLGQTLCVLDDATGREEWTRDFPYYQWQATLWPDEGVVTFARNGLAVFDLASRTWRWTLSDVGRGGMAVWVHGEAAYLGFTSGDLCRLRLSDGALVWKKKWPGSTTGSPVLKGAGNRLLFRPGGQRLVALSLDDDRVLWEMQPGTIDDTSLEVDEERAYLRCWHGRVVEAVSLADGKAVWEATIADRQLLGLCTVSDRALWIGGARQSLCLEKATGRILGASWDEAGPSSDALFRPGGEVLYASDRQAPSWWGTHEAREARPPRLLATRLVLAAEGPAQPLPKDDDPVAEVSLLEDACYGPASCNGETWLALADACIRAGHAEWGVDAVKRGLLLLHADLARVREWQGRIASESGTEEEPRAELQTLARELDQQAKDLEFVEAFKSGSQPPSNDGSGMGMWDLGDAVLDSSPETTVRRGIAMARGGAPLSISIVAQRLGDVPEPLALEGVGAILKAGLGTEDCSRLYAGSRLYGTTIATSDLEEAFRARLAGPQGALRGAALAALELFGLAVPEEGAEASLRAAFVVEEPYVRLAASAALARRGDLGAKKAILTALRSTDKDEMSFATWLAGNLRLPEAVEALTEPDAYGLEALAEIGTDAAEARVLEAAEKTDAAYAWPAVLVLARLRSEKAVRALVELGRGATGLVGVDGAMYGLLWMDTPASRIAALEPARAHVRLGAMAVFAWLVLAQGLVELGDVEGAEGYLAQIEAAYPPLPWALDVRMRVLAAKGDLAGAREARRLAEADMDRAEAIDPGAWKRLVARARLYLDADAIADREKARGLLEQARAIAPHDPEVARLLESLGGK